MTKKPPKMWTTADREEARKRHDAAGEWLALHDRKAWKQKKRRKKRKARAT